MISDHGAQPRPTLPLTSRRGLLGQAFAWAALGTGGLASGALGGCAPGRDLAPIGAYDGTVYRLGVGDRVRVITYGEQQLSQDFAVGDGGNFTMPLLGQVHAGGLTADELGHVIADQLRRGELLRNPSVAVEVTAYRPVSVLGEVAKPGQFPYQPGMTMLTAIAAAGGFTYRSVEDYAYVVREGEGGAPARIGRILPQDYAKPGDVIKVYERLF